MSRTLVAPSAAIASAIALSISVSESCTGKELADDLDLFALLRGKLGAAGIGVDLLRLLALLDHLGEQLEQSASVACSLPAVRAAISRSLMAALTMRSVETRRLACALVAACKAAVMVSRMAVSRGFQEEVSNLIEGKDRGKEFCRSNPLFSQENLFSFGLTCGRP